MNAAVVYSAAAFCFAIEGGDELPDTAHTNSSRGGEPPLAESWDIISKLLITGSVTHYFR